jgi:hypothetical protein
VTSATNGRIERRLAALEAGARRLLPQEATRWLSWLSAGELGRLELILERQVEAGEDAGPVPGNLCRRALARALMGIDVRQIDEQERVTRRLLAFDHPDHPGDRMRTVYASVVRDLVDPDLWHLDPQSLQQTPGLPAVLTAAETDARTVRDPW